MNYSYKIDLNRDYPYIQETHIPSEKTITWKLEDMILHKNEVLPHYQDSWVRVREWLKENHSEILL